MVVTIRTIGQGVTASTGSALLTWLIMVRNRRSTYLVYKLLNDGMLVDDDEAIKLC